MRKPRPRKRDELRDLRRRIQACRRAVRHPDELARWFGISRERLDILAPPPTTK